MSGRRIYRPYRIGRLALLIGLGLFVVIAVAVFLVRGRVDSQPQPPAARVLRPGSPVDLVMAGQGFDYEVRDGERPVYRIQAEEIVSDTQGRFALETVRLEIRRENGDVYEVVADRGDYQVETSAARLDGNVRVTGKDGFELRTAGLEVVREGTAIQTTAPVRFRLGEELSGGARSLFYHLRQNRVRLEGAVRVERRGGVEGPPASLSAERLTYDRDSRLGRAEGAVSIAGGYGTLRSERLSAQLAEDESTLEFVRARWQVEGGRRAPSSSDLASSSSFRSDSLSVAYEGGEPAKIELEGVRGGFAEVVTLDDSGLQRRLTAPYLTAELVAGEPDIVRAWDGVEIVESLPFAGSLPLRRVCTQWLLATFDRAGGIDRLALQNGVDYQEPGLQATGVRIQAAGAGGELDLFGDPATIRTDRGRFEAPRIAWAGEREAMRATEGVRAEMPESGRFGLIGEEGKGPIRVTSREASWDGQPPTFGFRGEVRAWQGQDYLLADRLEGDRNGDRLSASGRVKTVVKPPPEGDAAEPETPVEPPTDAPAEDGGVRARLAAERAPIEVSADRMVYERPERLLTYSGNTRAHQAGRTLTCEDLEVLLGERDRFERMTCTGEAVVIRNPDQGHTVRGRKAIYEPGGSEVRISGNPVVLEDREGGIVRGPYLIYNVDAGTARIERPPAEPADDGAEEPVS